MLDGMRAPAIAFALACGLAACKKAPPPAPPQPIAPPPAPEAVAEPEDLDTSGGFHPVVQKPDLAAPPPADTINGDRNGPKQSDFDAVEAAGQRKMQACFETIKWAPDAGAIQVTARFTVNNDGKVLDVQINATGAPEASACIHAAVEGMTFPKFEGSVVHTTMQSTFRKG